MLFIYKCYEKEIQIQQQGKPGGQHLGEVRQGTLKLKFSINNHLIFSVNLPIFSIIDGER